MICYGSVNLNQIAQDSDPLAGASCDRDNKPLYSIKDG